MKQVGLFNQLVMIFVAGALVACGASSNATDGGSTDAGTPAQDAGSTVPDAGSTVQDAGTYCNNTCPLAGATQCVNAQVETCTADANGCLAWGAATSCPTGQLCNGSTNTCEDVCKSSAVMSACASAAVHFNQCCGGTQSAATASDICHGLVSMGSDPQAGCSALTEEACTTISGDAANNGQCCCPSGQTCDVNNNNICVPTCTTAADCAHNTIATACAPMMVDGSPTGPYVCTANDGAAGDGCNGHTTCSSGSDCWEDAQGNNFCAPSCSTSADCFGGCCDLGTCKNAFESCGSVTNGGMGTGYCGPVPPGGCHN